jgi:hypothetical protein
MEWIPGVLQGVGPWLSLTNSPGMWRCDRTAIFGNLTGLWCIIRENRLCARRSLVGVDSQVSCEDAFSQLGETGVTVNNRTTRLWFSKRLLFLVAALVGFSATASADPIAFTFTGTASGTVTLPMGPLVVGFTDIGFKLTAIADTKDITASAPGILLMPATASIQLIGIGGGPVLVPTEMFDNQNATGRVCPCMGLTRTLSGLDILDVHNAVFGSYALNTSIGPILEPAPSQALDFLPNSLGPINFTQIGSVTFAAAVPEPSSLVLLSSGLLGLIVIARWKLVNCVKHLSPVSPTD